MINILTNCASIPANKVKLSDYPEVSQESIKDLDIRFDIIPYGERDNLDSNFLTVKNGLEINQKNKNTSCVANISSRADTKEVRKLNAGDIFRLPYYVVCQLSLTVIPCYKQNIFEARATLISTSNNKTLKEYYLKDKAHEVWSSLWMLSWFIVKPSKYTNAEYPKDTNAQIEQTISQSLTRQILNDAATFPECQKK